MTARPAGQPEWLRRKERGSVAAIKLVVMIALGLGRPAIRLFLPAICLYFLLLSSEPRRASRLYLTRALGRAATLLDVFRHYRAFASCVLDRVFFLKNKTELFDIRIFDEHLATDLQARGSGCILLGAHIGSFEVLRAMGRRQPNLRVNMVMFEENARKVGSVLNAINPELTKDIISLGKPDALLTVQNCLENGHFVGVLADRSLSDERRVARPFLGAPAHFSVDPFRMIALLQRPVLLMVGVYRGGNRYDIHVEPFASQDELPRRPNPEELAQIVDRYVARLEHYCRTAPYNWFNFYDIWH